MQLVDQRPKVQKMNSQNGGYQVIDDDTTRASNLNSQTNKYETSQISKYSGSHKQNQRVFSDTSSIIE